MADDPRNEQTATPGPPTSNTGAPDARDGAAGARAEPPTAEQVRLALRKVKDPELNLNIMDLGLVYDVLVEDGTVVVNMTLTSPGCPAGPQIMSDAERTLRMMPGVADVVMNLVWEPYWTPEKIEPRVRAYMGL
jgi:metal-sulfur cluster biosynthetic enzyme